MAKVNLSETRFMSQNSKLCWKSNYQQTKTHVCELLSKH